LVVAVETAGDITALAAQLRKLEARRREIDEEIRSVQPVPRLAPQVIEDRLSQWRRLLRVSITQGRSVLQRVLQGRITFTPSDDGGYTFEAPTRFDKLFSGIVVPRPAFIPQAACRSISARKTRSTPTTGNYWSAPRQRVMVRAPGRT
jgi:hypothetical protein